MNPARGPLFRKCWPIPTDNSCRIPISALANDLFAVLTDTNAEIGDCVIYMIPETDDCESYRYEIKAPMLPSYYAMSIIDVARAEEFHPEEGLIEFETMSYLSLEEFCRILAAKLTGRERWYFIFIKRK